MKTMKKEKLDAERVWKEFEEASGGHDHQILLLRYI
jgi:hypothetical protein